MTVKELRKASGMTQQQFGDYFGIPKRTIQNWEAGVNKCPEYLLQLMEFRLDQEAKEEKMLAMFNDVVERYKNSETSCIWECSCNIEDDEIRLGAECEKLIADFKSLIRADMERGGDG